MADDPTAKQALAVKLYSWGTTLQRAGEIAGYSRERVRQLAKREGVEPPYTRSNLTAAQEELIVELARQVGAIPQDLLGEMFCVSRDTVSQICHAYGLKRTTGQKPYYVNRDDVIEWYVIDGEGMAEIADRLGIAPMAVHRRLKEWGVTRHKMPAKRTAPPGWVPKPKPIVRKCSTCNGHGIEVWAEKQIPDGGIVPGTIHFDYTAPCDTCCGSGRVWLWPEE